MAGRLSGGGSFCEFFFHLGDEGQLSSIHPKLCCLAVPTALQDIHHARKSTGPW